MNKNAAYLRELGNIPLADCGHVPGRPLLRMVDPRRCNEAADEIERLKKGPEWSAFDRELARRTEGAKAEAEARWRDEVCTARAVRDKADARVEEMEANAWAWSRGLVGQKPYTLGELKTMFGPYVEKGDTTGLSPREARLFETLVATGAENVRVQGTLDKIADGECVCSTAKNNIPPGGPKCWPCFAKAAVAREACGSKPPAQSPIRNPQSPIRNT